MNEKSVDLESENSLGIRFNNVLLTPEDIKSSTGDYSFEFELPATQNNNKIFDYANVLAKTGKYHQRYNAEVEADGRIIFTGTLVLNSFSDGKYKANLVDVKTYSLEEIFGDLDLTKIPWYEEFSGVTSINYFNANSNDVKFPLVSYGVFAKQPYFSDEVGNEYTDKFTFDKYNEWYVSSFYPSANALSTVKKAFQWKGYNVYGNAFQDENLKNIYLSTNLDSEQVPAYNVGNPAFGQVDIDINYTTGSNDYMQELQFPYEKVQLRTFSQTEEPEYYNFDNILIHDILTSGVTTTQSPSYMYQPNEHIIVIPKSGFYKIELSATCSGQSSQMTAALHKTINYGTEWEYTNETISKNLYGLSSMTPVEIALVRNYDDNYELIKGKHNITYADGSHTATTTTWLTCFPHEDIYQAKMPTKQNDLAVVNQTRMGGGGGSRSSSASTSSSGRIGQRGSFGTTRGGSIDRGGGGRIYSNEKYGYMPGDYNGHSEVMCYDQAVSPSFICGLSSYQGGTPAVAKNGYSWSRSTAIKNQVFAPVAGYKFVYRSGGTGTYTIEYDDTLYNKNSYVNTPFFGTCSASNTGMTGNISCMMWLEKDDILNLFAVQRAFFDENNLIVRYPVNVQAHLKITAFSDKSYDDIKSRNANNYYADVEFESRLKITDFMNSGTSISSYIQGISDAFNLDIIQNGNNIVINKRNKVNLNATSVVDIDDRVNNNEAESSRINYPKSMAVKFKIDKDEWGFEKTVPADKINEPDWDKYGDSGYTVIKLNDDSYVTTEKNISLNFSYTYYDNFTWTKVDQNHVEDSGTTTSFDIPVISKSLPMVSGYSYDEAMKTDGYSLTQRFFYKPVKRQYNESADTYVWTDTYPQEKIYLYTPSNILNGINLSYKVAEKSLLEYFNIRANLASNYVTVNVYLTPDEYDILKGGGKVRFDNDLYDVVEITGYDPTGNNATELKLMKR